MKTFWIVTILAWHLQAFEYGLKPSQVNEKIYCFFGAAQAMDQHNNGNMVNSCFVDMDTSWLVIDSGPTYLYAKEAFSLIQKIKTLPVSYVINTHIHDDHWLGNGFYKTLGATIVGSVQFKTSVNPLETTRMQNRISSEAFEGTTITLPTMNIDKDLILNLNGKQVKIVVLTQKTHTQSDLLVSIPSQKALFAGDIIFSDRIPSARDGDITNWIRQLELIEAEDQKIIIGGHGSKCGKDATKLTKEYLTALKKGVLQALSDGVEIDQAVMHLNLKKFKETPMYDSLHKQNIETAFRALEWADE